MIFLISYDVGILHKSEFSVVEIAGVINCSRSLGNCTSSSVNKCSNFSTTCSLISFLFISQSPSSFFMASVEFLLRRMTVDRWKNLEFLSPSLSHNSLDFCLQWASFLHIHSFNSPCSIASDLAFCSVLTFACTASILEVSSLIRFWQWPKTFLFHFFRALAIKDCFQHKT